MRSFEELDCWKKATELRRRMSEIIKKFPSEEKYRLTDQIVRASRSVTANIAEGFGRFHYQEYIQFCRQSRGSLFELIDHFIVAKDENYISVDELNEIRNEIDTCLQVLNGFINYLSKAKLESKSKVEEPEIAYESGITINK